MTRIYIVGYSTAAPKHYFVGLKIDLGISTSVVNVNALTHVSFFFFTQNNHADTYITLPKLWVD